MTTFDRRKFLGGSLALGAATTLPMTRPFAPAASAASVSTPPSGKGCMLVIFLKGGNDGLNTIGPFTSGIYHDLRGELAVDPAAAFPAGNGQFFHPQLSHLYDRWKLGDVRVLPAVGHAARDHSHFSSQPRWMSGIDSVTRTGWLGRWLNSEPPDVMGASVDGGATMQIRGSAGRTIGVTRSKASLLLTGAQNQHVTSVMRGYQSTSSGARSLVTNGFADAVWASATQAPVHTDAPPDEPRFTGDMRRAANALNLGVGVRVVSASLGGFDTHSGQAPTHASLLQQLDEGIAAFDAALDPALVPFTATLVVSEFGRRAAANSSAGTDHGAAGMSLLIGSHVSGGLDHEPPSLTRLDRRGDLQHTVDFRRIYATVVSDWLGGDPDAILGSSYAPLDLFAAAPGDPLESSPGAPPPATATDRFVDIEPGAYYAGALRWAVDEGIIHGTSATTFAPHDPMTRAGFATVLHRTAGLPGAESQPRFTDVRSTDWFAPAVSWMVADGITSGTSPTQFSPSHPLTRGQAATFLWRWQGRPKALKSNFVDVTRPSYYAQAVDWMVAQGITMGTSAERFSPEQKVTRGQAVTFLWRMAGSPSV